MAKRKQVETRHALSKESVIVAKIISEFQDRNRADIRKWRQAVTLATDPTNPRQYVLQDLYDNLKADGHWISLMRLRKAATLCTSFTLNENGELNHEKTELFKKQWFFDLMDDVLDGIISRGFSLLELSDSANMSFKLVPRRNVSPTQQRVYFEVGGDKFISYAKGFETSLVHVGKTADYGLMGDLCGCLIWKRNAQQSWAEFSEKFGMPLLTATTNKTQKADLDNIESMLSALGEAARAVLPEGTTIDIKAFAGADAYQVYDKQIDRINSEISKALVGGTMLSDNGSSRSQSEVHERNLDDKLSLLDRLTIQFIVNDQLLPIMAAQGWDINPETDKFSFDQSFELGMKDYWQSMSAKLPTMD